MQKSNKKVPVHLITGFLGVGKTTAIQQLIAQKPASERWALIVNEFGQVGIDGSLYEGNDELRVKELPGGCICCALGLTLTVTLVNLLQRYRPDRLLIEPTGLGHPAGLVDLLTGEQFAPYVELRPLINLVDPRQLDDPRVLQHEVFQDQISLADILVFNKIDLADEACQARALTQAQNFFPPKLAVLSCQQGQLPYQVLDEAQQLIHQQAALAVTSGHQPEASLLKPAIGLPQLTLPEPEHPVCLQGSGQGAYSLGWVFHRDTAFDEDLLYQWMDRQDLMRLKAVVRVGSRHWRSFNKVGSELVVAPLAYRRDSRLELISEAPLQAEVLQAELQAMTFKPRPATLFDA